MNLFRKSKNSLHVLTVLTVISFSTASFSQNELQNGDFESDQVSGYGDHIGALVTGWTFGRPNDANLVKVDGPGPYTYAPAGPESDATGGIRPEQHYLDISAGSDTFYQSFTPVCGGEVEFGGSFSTRAGRGATFSLKIVEGLGISGNTVAALPTTSLPRGPSTTWTDYSLFTSLKANTTYTMVVEMDNNANFDNGFVIFVIQCDPPFVFDPCCPPWNEETLKSSLFMVQTGAMGDPYYVEFRPSQQVKDQMQAYIDYLGAIGECSNLSLVFVLSDFQGNPPLQGTPPGHTNWYVPGSKRWVKWSANGGPVNFSPFYRPGIQLDVGTWYRIGTGMYCQPEESFFSKECAVSYVDFRIQVLAFQHPRGIGRRAGRDGKRAMLEFLGKDGKIISTPVSARNRKPTAILNFRK